MRSGARDPRPLAHNPAYCLGLYGFTVRHDGGFTAGPSDQGVVVSGAVSADELERLSSDVSALSASRLRGAPSCDPGHLVPGIAVSVDVLFADQTTVRIVDNLCYLGGRDQALRLRDDLDALRLRYYPRPFP